MTEKAKEKQKKTVEPAPPGIAAQMPEEMSPAFKWAQEHAKLLVAAVSATILIAAGYAFIEYYQSQQVEKARVELATILATSEGPELARELADFASNAPDQLKMGALLELAKAYQEQGDYDSAAKTWEQVISAAGRDFELPARLAKASDMTRAGKYDQALAELESIKADAPESYAQYVNLEIADVAERAGDYARALAAFQSIRESSPASQQAFVDYKIREYEEKIAKNPAS